MKGLEANGTQCVVLSVKELFMCGNDIHTISKLLGISINEVEIELYPVNENWK